MEVRVTGGAELAKVRAALRRIDDKALAKQMSRGLSKAASVLPPEVREEIPKVMPSGYAPVLSKSMRFRTETRERSGTARVQIKVYGDGQKERRDVPRLNKGELRHPVFGRTRRIKNHAKRRATSMRNPWVAQKVRSGFVDKPAERLVPEMTRQMQAVIDDVAAQITKG